MNPLTEVLLPQFVTIVGLLCNWSQEKAAQSGDRDMTFLTWLEHHNFQELSAQLQQHTEVVEAIGRLQSSDLARLSSQMGSVSDAVSAVAARLDTLAPIVRHSQTSHEPVSSQALTVLRTLLDTPGSQLLVYARQPIEAVLVSDDGEEVFDLPELDLFPSDVACLVSFGFLHLTGHVNGYDSYSLTRPGKRFAEQATTEEGVRFMARGNPYQTNPDFD